MVNELQKSLDIALLVLESKKFSRLSNCKMMATRMMQFQLGTIAPKVKYSMERMHNFFVTTYSGVGCALCDAESHKFMDKGKKTLTIGEDFCRDITSNSLHVLLYLHIHYIKFYQLSSKFMAQCDHLGNYNEAGAVPAEAAIKIDEGIHGELMACREFRNDNTWLASCGAICEDFNLVKIEDTFFPHIDAFIAGTKFLSERHKAIVDASTPKEKEEVKKAEEEAGTDKKPAEGDKKEEKKDEQKDEKKEEGKQERILERVKFRRDIRVLEEDKKPEATANAEAKPTGEGATEEKKDAAPEEPTVPTAKLPATDEEKIEDAKNGDVFPHLPKKPETAAGFKPVFQPKGVNVFKVGKMVDFSDEKYDKIEKEVDEAAKKAAAEAKKAGDGAVDTVKSSFWFAGIDRVFVQSLMVMLGVFIIGF